MCMCQRGYYEVGDNWRIYVEWTAQAAGLKWGEKRILRNLAYGDRSEENEYETNINKDIHKYQRTEEYLMP